MISYTSFSFFLIYFGLTFLFYSLLPKKIRWCILLIGSYVFYFVSAKSHIFALLFSTVSVWAIGLLLQHLDNTLKTKRKSVPKENKKQIKKQFTIYKRLVMALGVTSVLSFLLISKYSNFFISTLNNIFSLDIKTLQIVQPLGISFFVLEAISYLADVYYGRIKAEKNPLRISLYLSFMLTVVEGPVARYEQLGTQLNTCKYNNLEDLSKGLIRVIWGLFKKVVIADRAAVFVNAVFDNCQNYSGISVIAATAFYTLQLYCEFSGVMDVMCGLGNMMGIQLPENFNQPFFAKTINEFWQRWHISLGSWLRDYIFYPISFSNGIKKISQKSKNRFSAYYSNLVPTAVALFFVWLANGFWHGAAWKYVVYGLYYYVLMMLGLFLEPLFAKMCKKLGINRKSKPYRAFQIIRTIVIVNIGMLIFRAENLLTAVMMLKSAFDGIDFSVLIPGNHNGFNLSLYDYAVIIIGFFILIAVGVIKEKGIDIKERIYKLPYILKVIIYTSLLMMIIIIGAYGEGYGVVDLIYANF